MQAQERTQHLVCKTANQVNPGDYWTRDLYLMITLNIKSIFNSAPWRGIIEVIIKCEISTYRIRTVADYRGCLYINTKNENKRGIPQGSVLGPLLWNLCFEKVLQIHLSEAVTSIAYANDLALLFKRRNEEQLRYISKYAPLQINKGLKPAYPLPTQF